MCDCLLALMDSLTWDEPELHVGGLGPLQVLVASPWSHLGFARAAITPKSVFSVPMLTGATIYRDPVESGSG